MIEHRIEGSAELLKGLDKLASAQARRDLLDQIGAYGVSSTQQRFLEEQGPEGEVWKKSRRARTEGGRTLRDSGRLYQSLTHEATASMAAWGSNVVYAGIHQFGGTIRPKAAKALVFRIGNQLIRTQQVNMPARPFLGIGNDDRAEIELIVKDWVTEALQ